MRNPETVRKNKDGTVIQVPGFGLGGSNQSHGFEWDEVSLTSRCISIIRWYFSCSFDLVMSRVCFRTLIFKYDSFKR